MSASSKRLRWVRESLRRPDGRPVDRQALSLALGWPENRWKNLEGALPWGDGSKAWVREGLLALVARTTLPEEAGPKAVAYVMGESRATPWSGSPEWKPGECPQGKPVGRPRRELSSGAARRESGDGVLRVARPMLPESVREAQLEALLRALEGGEIGRESARAAIVDLYEPLCDRASLYYNKHARQDTA